MSSSSEANDADANKAKKETENEQDKTSVPELLDELILHMNSIRSVFKVMILSSFILAPMSLILAGIFVIHPFFINRIMFRLPEVGLFLLLFIGVTVMLASMWLYIGLSEQRFFSNWDKKFSKYMSLKKQVDRELGND
jgi:hypothetical protein